MANVIYKGARETGGLAYLLIILTVAVLSSYQSSFAGVAVVESTPSRLVLDWEMTGFEAVALPGVSGRQVAVYYDGGVVPTGDSAGALIHARSIRVGVPARGEVRVSVESPEFEVADLGAPLQRRVSAPDSAAPRFVSRWVSEPVYAMLRGYRTAQILLRPVYDMGRGRVRLLRRARVVVEFPASAHTGAAWEPRGDYERAAARMLLNFRVAQGWHAGAGRGGLRKAAVQSDPYPFAFGQKLASFKVGDGNRNLNEGLTNENSLIKIRGAAIKKNFGANVRMSSVALYASHRGELDVQVPLPGDIPAGVYEVPLLRYDINGDDNVDDGDYVVACVSGASDWSFGNAARYVFSVNRYDDSRVYWLAVKGGGAGLEMERYGQPPSAGAEARGVYEANLYLRTPQYLSAAYENHEGGLEWVWKKFTPSRPDTTIRLALPGLDAGLPGTITFYNGSVNGGVLRAELGGVDLCRNSCGGVEAEVSDWGSRDLLIRYAGATDVENYYELKALHVRYSRALALNDTVGKLEVFSAAGADVAGYRLSKAGNGLAYVVRVPADGRGISLVDTVRAPSYLWYDVGGEGARYMVMHERELVDYSDSLAGHVIGGGSGGVKEPRYQTRDLRAVTNSTDFLIVTHEEFLDAALKLAAHKAGMGFSRPRVVLLGDITDQFGGGNTDPSAIRNFLYYVYGNWEGGDSFSYVTLLGAGHYDYKNVSSRVANFMPVPYISGRLSEDFYVFFDPHINPNSQHVCYYYMGRMPARSLSEAFDMVEKVVEMELPGTANFDSWRGRVLLSADDDQQGPKEDRTYRPSHTESSERISRIISRRRPDIGQRKIYLFEYPWDERYAKPAATRAYINEINGGVAVVNWFGHGAYEVMADEKLFALDNVSALENRKRYPLFSIFSCSVAKYDLPGDETLGSVLVRRPRGGAIAVVASAREVNAYNNESLAIPFFNALFDDSADGGTASLGCVLATAKADYKYADNRYYVLLGDPSMKIAERGRGVSLSVKAAGKAADTLKALQQVTIEGKVEGNGFGSDSAYADITLFNPPQDTVRRKDGGKFDTITVYGLPGSPVFSAKRVRVDANGEFKQEIRLPMNLAFEKPGVKLTAYVWKEGVAVAGAGSIDGLIFKGSESANSGDTAGPKISLRPVYKDKAESMNGAGLFVKNRITAQLPLTLEVAVEDESGINVLGSGPDEGLTMEVKGALSKRGINHLFGFDEGSFSRGKAMLDFEESMLGGGSYELIISAQDLLGNVSKLSVTWEVVDPIEIKLDHVMNIPNPVKMGQPTRFYYYHSNVPGDIDVNVTIRVYSLGGRLLSVMRKPRNGEQWVPRDNRGNYLTPNVYLYQITATSPNIGKTVKSKIKKLAVLPPR
jgi:hypothetical protein